jgi:hypothetical protein
MKRSIRTTRHPDPSHAPRSRALERAALSFALTAVLLAPMSLAYSAASVDPSGHWQGAIHTPQQDVTFAVDLALDKGGKLTGTMSNPEERINGYPFAAASLDGNAVRLELRTGGSGAQTFAGDVAADGRSMSGDFLIGIYSVPFELTRIGDAKFAPAPKSPAIDAALAGEWSASLDLGDQALPVVLELSNRADGTSAGTWAAGDGSATPVAIARHEHGVTFTSTVSSAEYTGTLSPDGKEISGTFSEGSLRQSMTFRRATGAR